MTTIVRGLLDYARRRPVERKVTNLLELAGDTLQTLTPVAKKTSIMVEFEPSGPLLAHVDPLHVQQALTNLMMNAIQAVEPGGHVRLTACLQQATRRAKNTGNPAFSPRSPSRTTGRASGRRPGKRVRPVLHDQGSGRGHGPGSVGRRRADPRERRVDQGGERDGQRRLLLHFSAASAGDAGWKVMPKCCSPKTTPSSGAF